ncbi:hypothetical protein PX52LOC_03574 [Limnoglobus roseus]|uniref:Uncharacterized protein n=1 Tax=Limnoglobus roseus TaxID=2598579 RepID=A0A5C1AHK5_9BACT|nr:hypothetical protein PX52LOC_03574 [Limnoglobus roseus]
MTEEVLGEGITPSHLVSTCHLRSPVMALAILTSFLGLLAFSVGGPASSNPGHRREVAPKADDAKRTAERARAYERNMTDLINEVHGEKSYLSSRRYHTNSNFARIVGLGRPVVPLVVRDLSTRERQGCAIDLLHAILPEVNLGALYDFPTFRYERSVHAALWARWWNEFGKRASW